MAVNGRDLDVQAGECFGLLGPNGAGKSTTFEILEGLLEPTAGDVEVLGMRWGKNERALRERLGVSLQQTLLPETLSVGEILTLFRSFFARGRDPDDVIRAVSLEEKRSAWYGKLSGGQKQRLAVACALVGDPDLLFLDEPTTGLDPHSRLQLWDVIEAFKRDNRTVMLSTHYMDEAERLCDRVGVVDHGKLIAIGTPRELISSRGGKEVIEVTIAQGARTKGARGSTRSAPASSRECTAFGASGTASRSRPIRCTSRSPRSWITCARRGSSSSASRPGGRRSRTSSSR